MNKDLLVENINQQTLIGQREVYNYFSSLEVDIHLYKIPSDLTKSCKWKGKFKLREISKIKLKIYELPDKG